MPFLLCKLTRECNLLRRTLLKEQTVLGIEKEDRKGAVEKSFIDVLHQMAYIAY